MLPDGARTIALVTDAWFPQMNGVVTTLSHLCAHVRPHGRRISVIHPGLFASVPCPRYPEIRLSCCGRRAVGRILDEQAPDSIHVATEGPLGMAARAGCVRRGTPFTTSFHTQFALYLRRYAGVPAAWSYAWLRRFHGAAEVTLVPTESIRRELAERRFANLRVWTRGVDSELFRPRGKDFLEGPRPIFMYVGRVAREKNIEEFLEAALPGTKYVVGDGPELPVLRRRHPAVRFVGRQRGEELARHYAAADVFVFPSRTDTFGVVLLEALACGVPVAAHPVPGPVDIVRPGVSGVLDEDLARAALAALDLDPADCRAAALEFSWERCAEIFLETLVPVQRSA
jgi:glycosyltransferase involved in cell wall biosynthesis